MGWNKDGSTIKAEYVDGSLIVGVVTESRVKYGGKVQYTVQMDTPVMLRYRSEPTYTVLIDEDNVLADFGILPETA